MPTKLPSGLPDAISRREILAGNPRFAVDLGELGRRYLAAGRRSDALDCFDRAKDAAGIEEIKKAAIEEDTFLLVRIAKSDPSRVTPDDWRRAAEKAEASGRDRLAALAWERAGEAARAEEAKKRLQAFRTELKPPTHGRRGLPLN
jgi:hypothetical protein